MKKDIKYRRRLLKLAAFLEKLPRERFAYDSWAGRDWKGKQDLSCGTTGCALGWAATMPGLRREGLRLRKLTQERHDGTTVEWGYVTLAHWDEAPNYWGANETSFEAASVVFGLEDGEPHDLFSPDGSGLGVEATAKQVARHIRKFVAEQTKAIEAGK